ncbi:hypothetical protein [Streptomyces sp. NPDC051286]|uniref:hypothetical protein n=1 Tax=Streptomyces sp. NPDC051286 TaxID=3365647 RepID=UPI0037BD0A3E
MAAAPFGRNAPVCSGSGRSSEITTARHNKITEHLRAAGPGALTDLGFVGLDDDPGNPVIVTGYKATRSTALTAAQKEANKLVSRERAANEHGRFRGPEELADPHRGPHESPARDHAPPPSSALDSKPHDAAR